MTAAHGSNDIVEGEETAGVPGRSGRDGVGDAESGTCWRKLPIRIFLSKRTVLAAKRTRDPHRTLKVSTGPRCRGLESD